MTFYIFLMKEFIKEIITTLISNLVYMTVPKIDTGFICFKEISTSSEKSKAQKKKYVCLRSHVKKI
jgi:hypothetical protein